jgi:hypothetical protein
LKSEQNSQPLELPNGCSKISTTHIVDGVITAEDHLEREILVAITNVSEKNPREGSELQAEVTLRNTGKQSIQVPWNTDPNIIESGQDPEHYVWEVGTFEVVLTSRAHGGALLKNSTQYLYGSQFSPGSMLTIEPGQWITAVIKFKLEDKYFREPGEFDAGKSVLSLRWHQTHRSWDIRDCTASNGFFQYDSFYAQRTTPFGIEITDGKKEGTK